MYKHNETGETWTVEELEYHFNWFKNESEYMSQFASVDEWIYNMLISGILTEI